MDSIGRMHVLLRISFSILAGCAMLGCGERSEPDRPEVFEDDQGRIRIRAGDEELYLAPASENAARVAGLLPEGPSEDVSHLLGTIDTGPADDGPTAEPEYLPSEQADWVLTVRFEGDPRLDPMTIENSFDRAWRERFGGFMSYGRDADTGRWTFLIAADGPKAVTQLKLAWDYVDPIDEDEPLATASMYQQRIDEVTRRLVPYGRLSVTPSRPPQEAVRHSRKLHALKSSLDWSAVVVLRAPAGKRFDGKTIWDVMHCLGLHWGDMDCFHWENPSGRGDDYFFSVWTSTPPGYFLPEQIAAGNVHVEDLVFGFSVPRCIAPRDVFEAMLRAAEYGRQRLGGTLVDEHGTPLSPDAIRARIDKTERELRDSGFAPGEDATLRLF